MINLRIAFRSLAKSPLITIAAILSLALGIGANAAIFSIFETLLLEPLPVEAPDRLVNLAAPGPKPGSNSSNTSGKTETLFSLPMFRDLQDSEEGQEAFDGIAAHRIFGANLGFEGDTIADPGTLVSGNYFGVLGLQPALGRLIGPDDDRTVGGHPVAVLSHSYWRKRFASQEDVIDKTLVVNGQPLTIVGVAPRGFEGTTLGNEPRVFVPISMYGVAFPGWEALAERRTYWVYVFGRLSDGTTLEKAQTAITVPYNSILNEVELVLQEGMSEATRERFAAKQVALSPGSKGQSVMYEEVSTPLMMLLGVTAFVLLIACANLANLLLVRATNRSGEIAVRLSLGAQRYQVVGQLLTESFVLGIAGSALGYVVAQGTLRALLSLMPPDSGLGITSELGASAWLFLAILAVVTGLVGLFPSLHITGRNLTSALEGHVGRTSPSRTANRFRASMATLQIALSMALLVSAGLFAKSLANVSSVDLGLETEHISTFGVSPKLNGYTPVQSRAYFNRVEEEVAALPGIRQISASLVPLISGSNWGSSVSVEGFPAGPDVDTHSRYNEVGPGYFETLGIPLLAGREFRDSDTLGAPKVAVVNETFAEKFGLGRDAVGKRMEQGSGGELDIEIVGLAKDSKYSEVKGEIPPMFILPYRQSEEIGSVYFYVRSETDPQYALPSIRNAVAAVDPNLPVEDLRAMTAVVKENVFLDRMLTVLSTAFALLATLLAAIGLYGVVAYTVSQRTREIGLRMALGADGARIRRLVLGQVGRMVLVGGVLGMLTALAVGRFAGSLLFAMESHDPLVLSLAGAILALVALGAGLLPARRAASIDPMVALRDE